jgi:endonuclease YncB( thermonuclease family)
LRRRRRAGSRRAAPVAVEMGRPARFRFPAVLSLCLALLAAAPPPQELRGRVVGVADGDTITVLDADKRQHRIRLNGIDAPETGQPFSTVSKSHLSSLVFNREVVVVGRKIDRYGRLIGTVLAGDVNANLEQLKAGLAWFYRAYAVDVPSNLRPFYEAAEREARGAQRGLWSDGQPLAPWDHRNPPAAAMMPLLSGAAPPAVIGNRKSKVYHLDTCPDFGKVAEQNRVPFANEAAAIAAGFRKAGNCRPEEFQ